MDYWYGHAVLTSDFQVILMDELYEIGQDPSFVRGESSIILRTKDGNKVVIAKSSREVRS